MTRLRCAIYTRKSSEEGLKQSFNSLDAQREACEAYVLSQKSEGWKALPALYDDGGFSGGKMDRPALQQLLRDISADRVDIVVVYKVDRLTRSLADFAKIVEVFDRHDVSFVSVTQAFNTTSSMGRLTLNVLLSFAQFEREVTGERIRDKIAASKAKGMWMGGCPPLGYEARDRALHVLPDEAETVRHIFCRYLELKSVNALAVDLEEHGVVSKVRRRANGGVRGATTFSRGALFHLLRNRIYVGEIVHKDQSYPGQHQALIDLDLFERVQQQLARNAVRRSGRRSDSPPLRGIIFDACGRPMSPAHAYGQCGTKYRYYVSSSQKRGKRADREHVSRVSAPLVEELVLDRLRTFAGQPAASWSELRPSLRRVEVRSQSVTLELMTAESGATRQRVARDGEAPPDGAVRVEVRACMQPRKGTSSVSAPAAQLSRRHFDQTLIAALKRAHRVLSRHGINVSSGKPTLEDARGLGDPYSRRLSNVAFLAPEIQRAIMAGQQPPWITLKRLTDVDLPIGWSDQRRLFMDS